MKFLVGIVAFSCGRGVTPQPAIQPARAPDPVVGELERPTPNFSASPAAKALGAWLDMFNRGDEITNDELHALRAQTGGLELVTLALGWEVDARFVVRVKNSSSQFVGWLQVTKSDPPEIELFEWEAIPPETNIDDAMTRARKLATEALAKHKK